MKATSGSLSGQMENFAQPGDVLIVISASGNSPNLVRAAELARERGVLTIGFLGFDGGVLKNQVDECLWIPTERGVYGLVESGHSLLCHLVTTCLAQDRWITPRAEQENNHVAHRYNARLRQ